MKNIFTVISLCLISGSCLPPGRMLLNMTIENKGEVVVETIFDVSDTSAESEMWDTAGECPFSVIRERDELPKPEQPEGARSMVELDGSVAISITWGGKLQTEATLEGATIETCSASCGGWHLTSETVIRAKEASGL